MTARCGSNNPTHRASACSACDRVYKRRSRTGAAPYKIRVRANAATCVMCGLTAGNSGDVPVYRYPLKRWIKGRRNRWIGSMAFCDRCLLDHAELKPEFQRTAA